MTLRSIWRAIRAELEIIGLYGLYVAEGIVMVAIGVALLWLIALKWVVPV